MIVALWILTFFSLALWSLVAWGMHAVLTLDPQWVGNLGALLQKIPYGHLIDAWFPGWQDLVRLGLELTQSLLGWIGGAAPTIVIVVWAIGALLIVGGAGVLTLIIQLIRRSGGAIGAPPKISAKL